MAELTVEQLDGVVRASLDGDVEEMTSANRLINDLRKHPEGWRYAGDVFSPEYIDRVCPSTKLLVLGMLEEMVKKRWRSLDPEERHRIQELLLSRVTAAVRSAEHTTDRTARSVLTRLNTSLVRIVLREWPDSGRTFIPDLMAGGVAPCSECTATPDSDAAAVCANALKILEVLSQECFDAQPGTFTEDQRHAITDFMMEQLDVMMPQFEGLLARTSILPAALIRATLGTLLHFTQWMPLECVFQSSLVPTLLDQVLPLPMFRSLAMDLLIEVGGIKYGDEWTPASVSLYAGFMRALPGIGLPVDSLSPTTQLAWAQAGGPLAVILDTGADGDAFVYKLTLFLVTVFRMHLAAIEQQPELHPAIVQGHCLLVALSAVPPARVFALCVDYWSLLTHAILVAVGGPASMASAPRLVLGRRAEDVRPGDPRPVHLYGELFGDVRQLCISRMVPPREVTPDGEIGIFATAFGFDSGDDAATDPVLYEGVRTTLASLAKLDLDGTCSLIASLFDAHSTARPEDVDILSRASWSVVALAAGEALTAETEGVVGEAAMRALVPLIEAGAGMATSTLATCLVQLLGSLTLFLNWSANALDVALRQLGALLQSGDAAVRGAAARAFLHVANGCAAACTSHVTGILAGLPGMAEALGAEEIPVVYEAAAVIVRASAGPLNDIGRSELLGSLFAVPNGLLRGVVELIEASGPAVLQQEQTQATLLTVLAANERAAAALKGLYAEQLMNLLPILLSLYQACTDLMPAEDHAGDSALAAVRRRTVKVVETYVAGPEGDDGKIEHFLSTVLPALVPLFSGYARRAHGVEIITLATTIADRCRETLIPTRTVPDITAALVLPTFALLSADPQELPEHRIAILRLVRSLNLNCFAGLLGLPSEALGTCVELALWAAKHAETETILLGSKILIEFFDNIRDGAVEEAGGLYAACAWSVWQGVWEAALGSRGAGFQLHATVLHVIVENAVTDRIPVPLSLPPLASDVSGSPLHPNAAGLFAATLELLSGAFQDVDANELRARLDALFGLCEAKERMQFRAVLEDLCTRVNAR